MKGDRSEKFALCKLLIGLMIPLLIFTGCTMESLLPKILFNKQVRTTIWTWNFKESQGCLAPTEIGINPGTNRIYIADPSSDDVGVIDEKTDEVVKTMFVGNYPRDITTNSVTDMAYVLDNDGISVVNAKTNKVIEKISLEKGLEGICVNPRTNEIYITNYCNDYVSVIDGKTNKIIGKIKVSAPWGISANYMTNRVYTANYYRGNIRIIY